jgi:hypothetical protein
MHHRKLVGSAPINPYNPPDRAPVLLKQGSPPDSWITSRRKSIRGLTKAIDSSRRLPASDCVEVTVFAQRVDEFY